MKFLTIKEAMEKGTGKVSIRGWVYRERGSSKFKFVVLRDSTQIIQCVIKKEIVGDAKFEIADKMQVETSLTLNGTIKADERAPTGFEIQVDDFRVIGESHEYPITKDQSVEFLADKRHLWLRSQKMIAIMKLRSAIFSAIREYCSGQGYYEYHSPIFQSIQCEGGSTLFSVPYFGKKGVFLAQTWQLYAEPAIFALDKIYTISPAFRAEKSKTSRHLTEFWMMEMEASWITFKEIQDFGESMIKHVIKKVLDERQDELKILERNTKTLEASVKKPFPRMTYTDSIKILKDKCKMDVEWGKDLRTIEEDKLSKLYDTPIIVTNYPKVVKAFYMKEDEEDQRTVKGCDFIAPEGYGEIIGGSEREADIEKIKKRLIEDGEKIEEYEFYLDTRRYGSVPHGGFGMGVERIIAWICGLDSIKDAIAFPRTMLRYKP